MQEEETGQGKKGVKEVMVQTKRGTQKGPTVDTSGMDYDQNRAAINFMHLHFSYTLAMETRLRIEEVLIDAKRAESKSFSDLLSAKEELEKVLKRKLTPGEWGGTETLSLDK